MKRYINTALVYAILAMIGGVFYREFTKFNGFTAKTTLAFLHTHYFMLGMVFFFHECENRTHPDRLSHRFESDGHHARRTRCCSGFSHAALPCCKRSNLRYGRHWTHHARNLLGACTSSDKAQGVNLNITMFSTVFR